MKKEKKEYLVHRQIYEDTVKKNKKLGMVNLLIFGTGLMLKYVGRSDLGTHFIWLGIVILIYTLGSNMMAKYQMKKHQLK